MAYQSLSPVLFESVSAVTASPSVDLGIRRVVDGNEYIYCFNAGNVQISQGMPGLINSANSNFSVSASNAVSQSGWHKFVGVCHNATLTTATYGWLMSKGVAIVALDASAVSMNSGDLLALGVDGGFVAAVGTSATAVPVGFAIASIVTTVGATNKAVVKSLIFS